MKKNSWTNASWLLCVLIHLIEFHLINLTNWLNNIKIKSNVERAIKFPVSFTFIFYLVYTNYDTPVQSNCSYEKRSKWYQSNSIKFIRWVGLLTRMPFDESVQRQYNKSLKSVLRMHSRRHPVRRLWWFGWVDWLTFRRGIGIKTQDKQPCDNKQS